ncbi:mitochondrial biogenesis AIM24-domain-containing protein [Myxozyma melibiosi]|uniref:Altered inheritance of mitochondria protein 24, mitochondrial n=1 Tax=Myxozyma melibiosi TaxID=54550 RepID=A0ABR1F5T7_9ASCO
MRRPVISCSTQQSRALLFSRRSVHIAQSPTASIPLSMDVSDLIKDVPQISGDGPFPKAPKFEVLGTPASLLNVALPASSTLYTRRGTLVGVNGSLENVTSTLSILRPTARALAGIPFLYQKITSTTPLTALITSKSGSAQTTFAVLSLDGRLDWTIAQRNALLAWSGSTLTVKPKLVPSLSLSRWGNTVLSGRGEVAIVGKGQIYQVTLQDETEEFAVHPANVVAYTSNLPAAKPTPYRLRHTRMRLQVPKLTSWFSKFLPSSSSASSSPSPLSSFSESKSGAFLSRAWYKTKSAIRTFIWGEELFFKFKGPCTVLVQSRAPRLADVIPGAEAREVYEYARVQPSSFAPAPAAAVASATAATEVGGVTTEEGDVVLEDAKKPGNASNGGHLKVASVDASGKVEFRSVDNFKEFIK